MVVSDPAVLAPHFVNNLGASLRCIEILIADPNHQLPYNGIVCLLTCRLIQLLLS